MFDVLSDMTKNSVETLKSAVRHQDPVLLSRAVDSLRMKGYTYRDLYRLALSARPDMDEVEWENLMEEADEVY